jgi:hypothetical protein
MSRAKNPDTRSLRSVPKLQFIGSAAIRPESASPNEIEEPSVSAFISNDTGGPLVGFLVSYDEIPSGIGLELRPGRWVVSSGYDTSDRVLFVPSEIVDLNHATLEVRADGGILVRSTGNGITMIRRSKTSEVSRVRPLRPEALEHGDMIMFGDIKFKVALLPRTSDFLN